MVNRRDFVKNGALTITAGVATACTPSAQSELSTPKEAEGPFYPVIAQKDKDFDLTQIEGNEREAEGERIYIKGRVLDTNGEPIESAIVDLWQANTHGRYSHPIDPNPAPLDPNFQGWAIVESGSNGGFNFKTVIPGAYPAKEDWVRPPHIHFKISKRGYVDLTTQMYFPGHELNDIDRLLLRQAEHLRPLMVASDKGESIDSIPVLHYDIILETV